MIAPANQRATLHLGDCLEVMPTLAACSVDSIVTDPPYGLSFMGKNWDHGIPGEQFWREAVRVAKPGAHLLAFGGTRTFHRLACAIEDAGWEIRDCVGWIYGQGFPKSHNLKGDWQGWGTALKPAWEPIIVARKPLAGTVAENVQEWGTGALNVDGCRVATGDKLGGGMVSMGRPKASEGWDRPWMHDPEVTERKKIEAASKVAAAEALGRWPANLIHDGSEEVVGLFPSPHGAGHARKAEDGSHSGQSGIFGMGCPAPRFGDSGSAARFFYCAKASKADRDEGCEGLEERASSSMSGRRDCDDVGWKTDNDVTGRFVTQRRNHHPTVKPTDLMRYLCRLVTPPDGVVLDPFTGSGSTGKAAMLEGFRFIGIEQSAEYLEIARARVKPPADMPLFTEATL